MLITIVLIFLAFAAGYFTACLMANATINGWKSRAEMYEEKWLDLVELNGDLAAQFRRGNNL